MFKQKVASQYIVVEADYDSYKGKTWIHYSRHEEMKFNYQSFHNDPIGIYFFPEGFRTEGSWHTLPLKFTAKLKPEANVLDLAKVNTKEDSLKLIEQLGAKPSGHNKEWDDFLEKHNPESSYVPDKFKFIDHAWDWLKNFYTGRKAAFTKRLMSAGYDAIFDDTNSIFVGETQLIVLNPKMLTDVNKTLQGDTGYREVVEARESILETLKGYEGKIISAPRPKKKKGFGSDPARIECKIQFGHDASTRTYKDHEGNDQSYPIYGREVTFTVETSATNMGGHKKRPATEISVGVEGTSQEYKKYFTDHWGDAKYMDSLKWRLEEFKVEDIVPWINKTMKLLWDDTEPAKKRAKLDEMIKQPKS